MIAGTSLRRGRRMVTVDIAVTGMSPSRRRQPELCLAISDPVPDRWIPRQVEATFMRPPRVGDQRNIGERECSADQKTRAGKMLLHAIERGITAPDPVGVELGSCLAEITHVEAAHGDVRFVAV